MKSPKQIKHEARQLFASVWSAEGRMGTALAWQWRKFLELRRRWYLALLVEFHGSLKLDQKSHTAETESVVPLPPELQTRVQTRIEGLYGVGLTTLFAHEPELIGGMRIRVGGDVYDDSIRSRLAELARRFGISNEKNAGG